MTFYGFLLYGVGAMVVPRLTLAVLVIANWQDQWAIGLAILCLMSVGEERARGTARYVVSLLGHLYHGREIVVEKIVEKIVEKEVEKIVVRTVTQQVRVRDLTSAEAASCLGCDPGDTREKFAIGYKEMIQKVHPDKGGSTYLAALVNQSKRMLVDASRT